MTLITLYPALHYFHHNIYNATHHRYMQLHFIREGDGYAEAYFARFLIEDRSVHYSFGLFIW